MAKTRIKRGNKTYVYERKNYRENGKVKHGKAEYLGIEEIVDGKLQITPPKRRQKDVTITQSEGYGEIAILYTLLSKFGIVDVLNDFIPRRGLPVGAVLSSLAINLIFVREPLCLF